MYKQAHIPGIYYTGQYNLGSLEHGFSVEFLIY